MQATEYTTAEEIFAEEEKLISAREAQGLLILNQLIDEKSLAVRKRIMKYWEQLPS